MMKKTILLAAFALISFTAFAQQGPGFGIKGGLNYGANGDYFEAIDDAYKSPKSNVGYHVGIFGKLGNTIYFRPELMYTKMKSEYKKADFDMSKLDAPLLVGLNIIGPLDIFAGPAFQYILDTDFEDVTLGDVKDDFSVGLHVGAGVSLGRLGIDLRYERGFNKNEVEIISNNIPTGDRIDTRPDLLILSLSLRL